MAFLALRWTSSGDSSTVAGDANLTRQNFSQTWTGTELIVWGGWGSGASDGRTMFGDGAAYNPQTDSWRGLASSPLDPRWGHATFWDGDEVVIMGGVGVTDGAAYNPTTDEWRELDSETPYEANGWNVATASADGELVVWDLRGRKMWSYASDDETWTELPRLPMSVNAGRVAHVGDQLVAVGLPMPTDDQQVRTAVLAADRSEWQLGEELDGSMIGEIDVGVLQGDDGAVLMMWGSASGADAWEFSIDFAWDPVAGPGLTPCDGAPEVALAGNELVVRSLCDESAVRRSVFRDGDWTTVEFVEDNDPAPVWTGRELIGLGSGGEIYTWQP